MGKGGGGVVIYHIITSSRNDFAYDIFSISPGLYSESSEHLLTEVSNKYYKFLLCVFYCPFLRKYYFLNLKPTYYFQPIYDHILLLTNFKTCLAIKNNARANMSICYVLVVWRQSISLPIISPT